jgi:2-phospho-L-lactate/phosphoenolpyruvate guanylyltransferase
MVVPVKRLQVAKSRLYAPGRPRPDHAALALALALDTVAAAAAAEAVARVLVVTDDPEAAAAVRAAGALVVEDEPDAGLNPALAYGAQRAAALAPAAGVALLSADLPALRPAELTAALDAAAHHRRSFVPDAAGAGTTLLAAAPGVPVDPRYGAGSAAAHRASGAVPLPGDWPSLRRDVDTAADLAAAAELGLGPATRAWTDARAARDRTPFPDPTAAR